MTVKNVLDEDFVNYKEPTMTICMPRCSLKCDELNGCQICQNASLLHMPDIEISNEKLIERYINNPITHAILFSGLEPLDTFASVLSLIIDFRGISNDPIIIYTGYTESEVRLMGIWDILKPFGNIIIKVGRYIMNCEPHYDELLGVELASPNQYAVRIE